MTVKTSIVTGVVGAALVLVPSAWGKGQLPAAVPSDAVDRAVIAQQQESTVAVVQGDAFERALAGQSRPDFWNYDQAGRKIANTSPGVSSTTLAGLYRANGLAGPSDRSIGLNRMYGLGEFATSLDAFERAAASGARGVSGAGDRSIELNRLYGLGEFAQGPISDTHDRVAPVSEAVSLATVGSGRDLEWPQLGIGFGVGILLAFGLWLAVRMTRIPPLAH